MHYLQSRANLSIAEGDPDYSYKTLRTVKREIVSDSERLGQEVSDGKVEDLQAQTECSTGALWRWAVSEPLYLRVTPTPSVAHMPTHN